MIYTQVTLMKQIKISYRESFEHERMYGENEGSPFDSVCGGTDNALRPA